MEDIESHHPSHKRDIEDWKDHGQSGRYIGQHVFGTQRQLSSRSFIFVTAQHSVQRCGYTLVALVQYSSRRDKEYHMRFRWQYVFNK